MLYCRLNLIQARIGAVASVIAALLLCSEAPLAAGPLDDGIDAYNRADYSTAYRLLRPLAEGGVPDAQFMLGALYEKGLGVPQDFTEALKWYRKDAEAGDAAGQLQLGSMYLLGHGVPKDYGAGVVWVSKSAEQNNAAAQATLGLLYLDGKGVPTDYAQAYKWFTLALAGLPEGWPKIHDDWVAHRDRAAAKMTPDQIANAQKLIREWKPSNP